MSKFSGSNKYLKALDIVSSPSSIASVIFSETFSFISLAVDKSSETTTFFPVANPNLCIGSEVIPPPASPSLLMGSSSSLKGIPAWML